MAGTRLLLISAAEFEQFSGGRNLGFPFIDHPLTSELLLVRDQPAEWTYS
jgi:hypothetical protein